jgi:hypothetical protein
MARNIPMDEPLTREDRKYLSDRGREDLIARLDEENGVDEDEAEEAPDYTLWGKADLLAEVDKRNQQDPTLQMSASGTKAELAARLEAHDESLADAEPADE